MIERAPFLVCLHDEGVFDFCAGRLGSQHRETSANTISAVRENTGNKRGHPSAESTGIKRGQSC